MKPLTILLILLIAFSCGKTNDQKTAENEEVTSTPSEEVVKRVFFKYPENGAKIASPFVVEMGVEGMEIEPAGEVNEGKGHHHLIIDGAFVEEGTIIPADETHIHFGKGQTEAEISLEPGKHTLTLQFADGIHASYGEQMSATVEIEVLGQ